LDTLAAAYAEAGRYADAAEAARRAVAAAESQNDAQLATRIRARLKWYESDKPYRLSP
jgi:Arc/MetJ-type ribon-helix-helix transcriptional regulator